MMFVTSKHVLQMKKCRNLLKNYDLFSAVATFWFLFDKDSVWLKGEVSREYDVISKPKNVCLSRESIFLV